MASPSCHQERCSERINTTATTTTTPTNSTTSVCGWGNSILVPSLSCSSHPLTPSPSTSASSFSSSSSDLHDNEEAAAAADRGFPYSHFFLSSLGKGDKKGEEEEDAVATTTTTTSLPPSFFTRSCAWEPLKFLKEYLKEHEDGDDEDDSEDRSSEEKLSLPPQPPCSPAVSDTYAEGRMLMLPSAQSLSPPPQPPHAVTAAPSSKLVSGRPQTSKKASCTTPDGQKLIFYNALKVTKMLPHFSQDFTVSHQSPWRKHCYPKPLPPEVPGKSCLTSLTLLRPASVASPQAEIVKFYLHDQRKLSHENSFPQSPRQKTRPNKNFPQSRQSALRGRCRKHLALQTPESISYNGPTKSKSFGMVVSGTKSKMSNTPQTKSYCHACWNSASVSGTEEEKDNSESKELDGKEREASDSNQTRNQSSNYRHVLNTRNSRYLCADGVSSSNKKCPMKCTPVSTSSEVASKGQSTWEPFWETCCFCKQSLLGVNKPKRQARIMKSMPPCSSKELKPPSPSSSSSRSFRAVVLGWPALEVDSVESRRQKRDSVVYFPPESSDTPEQHDELSRLCLKHKSLLNDGSCSTGGPMSAAGMDGEDVCTPSANFLTSDLDQRRQLEGTETYTAPEISAELEGATGRNEIVDTSDFESAVHLKSAWSPNPEPNSIPNDRHDMNKSSNTHKSFFLTCSDAQDDVTGNDHYSRLSNSSSVQNTGLSDDQSRLSNSSCVQNTGLSDDQSRLSSSSSVQNTGLSSNSASTEAAPMPSRVTKRHKNSSPHFSCELSPKKIEPLCLTLVPHQENEGINSLAQRSDQFIEKNSSGKCTENKDFNKTTSRDPPAKRRFTNVNSKNTRCCQKCHSDEHTDFIEGIKIVMHGSTSENPRSSINSRVSEPSVQQSYYKTRYLNSEGGVSDTVNYQPYVKNSSAILTNKSSAFLNPVKKNRESIINQIRKNLDKNKLRSRDLADQKINAKQESHNKSLIGKNRCASSRRGKDSSSIFLVQGISKDITSRTSLVSSSSSVNQSPKPTAAELYSPQKATEENEVPSFATQCDTSESDCSENTLKTTNVKESNCTKFTSHCRTASFRDRQGKHGSGTSTIDNFHILQKAVTKALNAMKQKKAAQDIADTSGHVTEKDVDVPRDGDSDNSNDKYQTPSEDVEEQQYAYADNENKQNDSDQKKESLQNDPTATATDNSGNSTKISKAKSSNPVNDPPEQKPIYYRGMGTSSKPAPSVAAYWAVSCTSDWEEGSGHRNEAQDVGSESDDSRSEEGAAPLSLSAGRPLSEEQCSRQEKWTGRHIPTELVRVLSNLNDSYDRYSRISQV